MSLKLVSALLGGSTAAALGLCIAASAQAQPNGPVANTGPYYDTSASVGGVTVTAPFRRERSINGAPVVITRASRVVPISDLDLSTGWGTHVLHERVERAAYSACNELDMSYTRGLIPMGYENDADCEARAVDGALAQLSPPSAPGY